MIKDTNIERRNLMMMSIIFIIYNFGDGHIENNILKLPLISITFNDFFALSCIATIMLLWFLLRYWQINKGKLIGDYYNYGATYNLENKKKLNKYLTEKTNRISISNIYYDGKENINYTSEYKQDRLTTIRLKKLDFLKFKLDYIIQFSIRNDGVTSYVVPYIVFIIALASPLVNNAK
jgi:hypothetical protein